MGLFANMKSAKVWKTGKKHAEKGNHDKALVYFDDAARMASDQKTLFEHRMWYYLTQAIKYAEENKSELAKAAYDKCMEDIQSFKAECDKTPGVGTRARFSASYNAILAFAKRNQKALDLFG